MKWSRWGHWIVGGFLFISFCVWLMRSASGTWILPEKPMALWTLASFTIHLVSFWLGSLGWLALLEYQRLGGLPQEHRANYWKSLGLYPVVGSWGTTLGRYWLSRHHAASKTTLALTLLIEKGLIGIGAILSFGVILGLGKTSLTFVSVIILLTGLFLSGLALFYGSKTPLYRFNPHGLRIIAIYGVASPCSVLLSLLLLARAFHADGGSACLLTRNYLLAWMIGHGVPIFPQGLGVREAAFTFIMHEKLPLSMIAGYALWERLIASVAQSGPGVLSWLKGARMSGAPATTPYEDLFPGDAVFDRTAREVKGRRITHILTDALSGTALKKARLLDCGCADGYMTEWFAGHVAEAWGTDAEKDMIQRAQSRTTGNPQIHFVKARAEALPFEKDFFDIVICNQVYEHVQDPARMMAEIHRVLKPKGICYFGARNRLGIFDGHYPVPTLAWWPRWMADLAFRLNGQPGGYPVRLLSLPSLQRLLTGFVIDDYTLRVLKGRDPFIDGQDIPGAGVARHVPSFMFHALFPLLPGYLWILRPEGKS